MAKTRLITTNLVRCLDQLNRPLYLIEDAQILYANQACLEWVQVAATDLGGTACRFTSEPLDDQIENQIKGLALPPDLWARDETENPNPRSTHDLTVFAEDNQCRNFRKATAICLDEISSTTLVVCEEACSPKIPTHHSEVAKPDIHALLASLRKEVKSVFQLPSVLTLGSFGESRRKKIDAAIQSLADLVVIGPQGSGREHLARAIDLERREGPPPIPIHCEMADQELIQSNLRELMSAADDHTTPALLLLDIDQMSELSQAELWGFCCLPGFRPQILSTARVPLQDLAQRNKFHTDLAEHLTTISIELRPLNERAGDIPILAQMFLENFNKQNEKQLGSFSPDAIKLLQEYEWPRNIDQLQRNVEQACRIATGTRVELDNLPEKLRFAARAQELGGHIQDEIKLDDYLQKIERELIARAIQQSKGNKSKAAKMLGISRPKLLRRLQTLELEESARSVPLDTNKVDSSAFEEAHDEN